MNTEKITELIEKIFKYKGTNYSRVAAELKGKNGNQMSRQVLYRMVKSGTLSMATFLEITEKLGINIKFHDGELPISDLSDVKGGRVKKKIKGVVYDTDKMFSVGIIEKDDHICDELCWEPVSGKFVVVCYSGDEKGKKYPYIKIVEKIEKEEKPV